MMEVIVEYDYQAQNPDELTIKKGDRIRNVSRKEEGWYEGELVATGRQGVFPDNFVKPVKPNLMKNIGFNTNLTKSLDDSLSSSSSNPNAASMSLSSTLKKKNVLNNTSNILTTTSNGPTMNGSTNLNGSLKSSMLNMQPITSPPPPPPPSSAVVANSLQNVNNGSNNNKSQMNGSLNSTSPPPPPPPPVTKPNESFTAKVLYSYVPANDDECAIQENDIVQVLRLVEDGWYEGIHNGKRGVFPSNYVEKLSDSTAHNNSNNLSNESLNNSSSIENVDEDKKKNKKVLGIGFGNIFSGKQIELKTKENFNKPNGSTRQMQPMPQPQLQQQQQQSPQHQQQVYNQDLQVQMQPTAPGKLVQKLPPDLINTNNGKKIKARVLYDYEPTQPDELKLVTGELIYILDKNLEDEGWWKGESLSTGEVGVFPDNFVEQINEPQLTMNNHLNKGHLMLNAVNKRKTPTAPYPVVNNVNANNNNVMANSNSNGSVKNVINDMNLLASSSSSSSSSSSASTSSSNNSLSKQGNTLINNNNNKQHMQHISSSLEDQNNNSKSQSDISEDLEDIRENDRNKLTHIKKSTRQFNKRPPSFRSKNHKVEDDEETNSFKQSNSFEKQFNGTHSPMQLKSPLSSMQPLQANMQPAHQLYTQQIQQQQQQPQQATFHHPTHSDVIREQTPPSPVLAGQSPLRSNSILGHSASASHMQQINLMDELGALRLELDQVKKNSVKSQSDYKQVENELNELKKVHDEQMKKMQKRLQDLISEIDEEKKTRLALQVELERLKKTIMNN